ncbi:myb-like DNA-binding protein [Blastomyces dermatitidis ER-3]|uniref:Myb-like DNA-binding protein n=1 Tax=Ajellomyces dermatitidis (strain ER-3 / ATCC MYA-2586) TaxID=559297 RepID=A0ABP2F2Q7_AJEDR|nr:myb-like DNA-binding protein [Blastomyces dermatitidis ER-3]EEQ91107.1 myb-like DNA-binding protein [Blastomyces dermatitidis ER-3]
MPAATRATSVRAQWKSASKQPPNLPRSTRQTRSRSRELGGIDHAPASPSKSVATSVNSDDSDVDLSHTPVKNNRAGNVRSKTRNYELSPVYESPRKNAAGRFNTDLTRQNSRRSERSVPESPVDHFNITGTTLLATDSEHESRELDPSIMIEALPDLDTSTKNALRILVPQAFSLTTLLKNLKNATFRARVKRIRDTFETQKKYFGGQHFITVEAAVNMLPSLKHIPWYPDEFIQKANLVQFALDLIPLRGNMSPFSEYHLSDLDESFPVLFISSFLSPEDDRITTPGQSALLDETFQLGLELRTQRAIAELRSGEQEINVEFAPDSILETVFTAFAKSGDESERLLGWKISGLRDEGGGIPERFYEKVLERRASIRKTFNVDETTTFVHFDELESTFPWSEFVVQACKWIRMRANEIDEQLEKQASLNEAVEILQIEVDRRSSLDQQSIASIPKSTTSAPSVTDTVGVEQADVQKPQITESTSTRKSMLSIGKGFFKSKAFVSHLVNLQARVGSAASNVRVDQPSGSPQTEAVAAARDSTPHVNDGEQSPSRLSGSHKASAHAFRQSSTPGERTRPALLGGSPRPSPSEIVKIAERQRLATSSQRQRPTFKTPPAAFIDRQADARRLSPIGSSQLASSDRSRLIGRSKKRHASEVEEDEGHAEERTQFSEEEGFEADTRNIRVEKKRASIAGLQGRKRRRVETATPCPSATPPRQSQNLESRQGGRVESESVEFTNVVGNIPPASTAPEINRRVRKPGGGRIPWSVDECNQLKNMIVRHGPKWAKIKQVDDSLEHPKLIIRDQVNLKDKARQMAVDYYKAGQPLPENFEKVPLKTEDKRKLREMGITIFEDMLERD